MKKSGLKTFYFVVNVKLPLMSTIVGTSVIDAKTLKAALGTAVNDVLQRILRAIKSGRYSLTERNFAQPPGGTIDVYIDKPVVAEKTQESKPKFVPLDSCWEEF